MTIISKKLHIFLFVAALASVGMQANAKETCDSHAKHIDHEIGADDALAAYDELHGDKGTDHHVVDKLKASHPKIEHELEEFVKAGCSRKDLEAHADDEGNPAHH